MEEFKGKIKLAISPCPNDTFIFGAWINSFLDGQNNNAYLEVPEVNYLDIQELNELASTGEYDVIKVSAAHVHQLLDKYDILSCGAALGEKCGPLLITTKEKQNIEVISSKIGLPGIQTTAHMLFNYAYPKAKNKEYMIFSEIEEAIINGEVDCGVIIHENRFTYQDKGLVLISDLGYFWQEKTNLPIPLGLILVKKNLSKELKMSIKYTIQQSILFANEHISALMPFIRTHAQELEDIVIDQHIKLYVNNFSLDLGVIGIKAVQKVLQITGGEKSLDLLELI